MNAWLSNTIMAVKLTLRDRQALFWMYVFPLFFLFLFGSVFGRGNPKGVGTLLGGLLCINAMAGGLFGFNIGLVMARERGILRRYRLAPIHPWLIISSEVVSSLLVVLSSLMLQLGLAKAVYRVQIAGSWAALIVMLSVGALAFVGIGFIIASVAKNAKVAPIMANVVFFPLMFLGGAAFPLAFLPPAIRKVARVLPSSYLVDGLGQIIVGGAGLGANLTNLAVLAITFVVALAIASKLFRWE